MLIATRTSRKEKIARKGRSIWELDVEPEEKSHFWSEVAEPFIPFNMISSPLNRVDGESEQSSNFTCGRASDRVNNRQRHHGPSVHIQISIRTRRARDTHVGETDSITSGPSLNSSSRREDGSCSRMGISE